MAFMVMQRLVALALTLVSATLIIFVVMEVLPGDPATIILGLGAEPDTLAALRAELGLDRPVVTRYFTWLWALARGDLGNSYTYSVPVAELIGARVMVSLPLAVMAMVLSTAIAIPAGVLAAARWTSLARPLAPPPLLARASVARSPVFAVPARAAGPVLWVRRRRPGSAA